MLLNYGVEEDSWESLGLQRDPNHQSWVFIGRTDAEAEITILWPPDEKNWLIGKDPDAGDDWRQEEKGMTEDEVVWWHHQLGGHEFEQASGVGDGQGSLTCFSPWDLKELDMTEWLNWTELNWKIVCSYSLQFLGSDEVITERYLLYNTVYIHMFSNIHDIAKNF